MVQSVIKRDGRKVPFVLARIERAVMASMNETGDVDHIIAGTIARDIAHLDSKELGVEEIQDKVENMLMDAGKHDAAKAYILYRDTRDKVRGSKSNQVIADIIAAAKNDITRENANMNASTSAGMMMKIASERSKEYSMNFLLSEKAKQLFASGLIHIHDFDHYACRDINCLQHPVDKILKNGFSAGHGESRPAKRIETASILMAISLETVQNEAFGGQAIPAFDFYLAPYVRMTYKEEIDKISDFTGYDLEELKEAEIKDYIKVPDGKFVDTESTMGRIKRYAINATVERVHQAMEAFVHNMNQIHSRGGNQVVFSSINYGTDTSAEGRCVIREVLNSIYQGVGNGSTAIFPISVWKKKRGVNFLPGDPNYDLFQLACKVTARRFFPNFLNLDATFNQSDKWDANDPKRYEHEVATMGCRTRVFEDRFGESTSIGRGNLSFTTINLPGLALSVKDEPNKVEAFFSKLSTIVDGVAEQLYERYKFQCTALAKQAPLMMSGLWKGSEKFKSEDKVGAALKHGTLGVGYIGLAECLIVLTGKHHGESEASQKLGLKIITSIYDQVRRISNEKDLNYSVFATPAEGLSGKFTKMDKLKYGIIPGVTDKEYYTNSNHVPVYYKCSASHKAEVEAPYHELTRGGHIFYVEMDGDATHNVEAINDIVKLVDKYNIGYASVNHNRNRCLDCGYENADKDLKECPHCHGHNIDKLQRITGYLVGTTDRWNSAKLAELNDRVTHD